MNRFALRAALLALALAACQKSASNAESPAAGGSGGSENAVVATFGNGQRITQGELDQSIGRELYQARRQGLESMILRRLVEDEAKKQGKTEEQLLKGVEEQATAGKTDDDLRKVYEQHKDAFGGRDFEQSKPLLKGALGEQAVMAYLEQLKQQNNVKITLPEPRVQVAANGPAKGAEGAPVTIVEFSDFQCPFCSKAVPTMDQLLANYAGKVRLVFRHFPLPFHENAQKAAEAAVCADQQGKFWQLHDAMFAHQTALAVNDLKSYAQQAGLDAGKFQQCLDSGAGAQKVQQDMADARKAGVESTPAFFVNGKLLMGALPYEQFKQAVDDELSKSK
jgi:protein-disulfide isomerase